MNLAASVRSVTKVVSSALLVCVLLLAPSSARAEFPVFSAPAPLNSNASFDTDGDYAVQLASDGNGNWVAVWTGEGDSTDADIFFARSSDNGRIWTSPAPLNTDADTDSGGDYRPKVATDGEGNWLVVWYADDTVDEDSDIVFARSTDNGATWTAPAPLNSNAATDSGNDSEPRLTTNRVGTWIAVWESGDSLGGTVGTDLDILVARSTDNGATWTPPALLNSNGTTDSKFDENPDLANDGAGNWVAVWQSQDSLGGTIGEDWDILYARSTDDGVTWSAAAPVNGNAANDGEGDADEWPVVAMDAAGNWIAAWRSTSTLAGTIGTDADILSARSGDFGATWSAPAPLNSNAATDEGFDGDVQVVREGEGNWIAVWKSQDSLGGTIGTDSDILFARSTDNGATWGEPAPLVCNAATDTGGDTEPQLATDGAGTWIAAWASGDTLGGTIGTDDDILFARAQAPIFGAPAPLISNGVIDDGDASYPVVANDGAGNLVSIWYSNGSLVGAFGNDSDIFFARSPDNGATWTLPAPLNSNAATDNGDDSFPHLATDGAGKWIAVWESDDSLGGTIGTENDVLFARSDDNGATWTPPAPLNSNAATDSGDAEYPRITTDRAGNWIALWQDDDTLGGTIGTDSDILFARSTNNGATWTPPVPLNSNAATDSGDDYNPQVATDGAGNWIAAWDSGDSLGGTIGTDGNILYARSTSNGATWTPPAALNSNATTNSGFDEEPRLATDGAGEWIAVWVSTDSLGGTIGTDRDILFARSPNNGATWTPAAPLNSNAATDSGVDGSAVIASLGPGNWVAAWDSEDSLGGTIGTDQDVLFARSYDDGARWFEPAPLNSNAAGDSGRDIDPQITSTGGGNWIALWVSNDPLGGTIVSNDNILIARMPAITQAPGFGGPAPLNTNAAIDSSGDSNPQIATDDAGNWVAVWNSTDSLGDTIGTDLDILVARSTNRGQTWTAPAPLNSDAATDIRGDSVPQIATDGEGTWIAAWQSSDGAFGSDLDILLARSTDNGATWTAPAPLNPGAATDNTDESAIKLVSIGMGDWVAVWEFSDFFGASLGTDYDLLVARSTDNGATWTTPVPLNINAATDSGDDYGVQLALNNAGVLLAVWESNDSLGGAIGTDTDILHTLSYDGGASWGGTENVNLGAPTDAGSDGSPHVATDGDEFIVVWSSSSLPDGQVAADFDIRFRRVVVTENSTSLFGETWLNTSAYSDSRTDGGARVSTDGAGLWTVVWTSNESFRGTIGTDTDILLAQSTNNGATWSVPFTLNSNAALDTGEDVTPQIATDSMGNWVVVWGSRDSLCGTIGPDQDILFATGLGGALLRNGNGFVIY